jgi:hypothetical protein
LPLALLANTHIAFGQSTLSDTFDSRGTGATDLSSTSSGGLSWTQLQGGVRVDNFSGQPSVANSHAMIWPRINGTPTDTIVLADQITDWNSFFLDFGWSSKYVRKTAGLLLLYKDPDNFYFLRLGSLQDGQLIRRQGGVETVLASGDIEPPDVGDAVVTAYRVQVQVQTTGILFRADRGADGTSELEFTDTDTGALAAFGVGGRTGFRWLIDNGAYHLVYIDRFEATGSHTNVDTGPTPTTGPPAPSATPTSTSPPPLPTPTPTPPGPSPTPTNTVLKPSPTPTSTVDPNAVVGTAGTVADLAVSPSTHSGGYRITFTAPDGNLDLAGMQAAAAYDIRYSDSPISSEAEFQAAVKLPNIPDPWVGGIQQSIECFSLPAGPLQFRMKVFGTTMGGLSNTASGSPSSGSPQWTVPANGKVGIDLKVAGGEFSDYVYETLFYDTHIDDHGILYLRDTVQLALAHNAKNAKPANTWGGGTAGVTPTTSADPTSLAGDNGVLKYRFDSDGLRVTGAKQAYVENGETYGTNTYKSHPMFKTYAAPFTPKAFYDSIDSDGMALPSERIGQSSGSAVDDRYHKGYTDPDSGDEWHELGYWDDDLGWLGNKERESQASDGRLMWIVLNPKTPVPSFSAGSGGKFFTTRPKGYYQGKVVPQTTYFSGDVTLRLANLSSITSPIQYRVGAGNWTDYSAPISLATLGLSPNTPVAFEMRLGPGGPIKRRTLVRDPALATTVETHPALLFRAEERSALWSKIQSNATLANEYKKLKTNSNQVQALMTRNYEVDERVKYLGLSGQTMSAAVVYALEGTGPVLNSTYTGVQMGTKAFRSLLAVLSSYDPLGDESQAGQWSSPCGEICLEWWDRGLNSIYAHMAYDMLAGMPGINPIDDLKLREALAQEAYLKMRFIPEIRGNWNLKASGGLLCAAYSMPSYDSPAFGGADSTAFDGNPFTPGLSWKRYVEDSNLPEGQIGGPKLRSTLWDSVWPDGMSKESSSYDASGRVFLTYFLNLYAGFHGVNLMTSHPEFRRAYEWSMRSRFPWNRNYQSYGQARYALIQDVHLLINKRFENFLDLGTLRWHYEHHTPTLGINPNSQEPIPFVLAWHDPTYAATPPADSGSRSYHNNMIFQRDFTDPNTVQLFLWGRETSWESYEAHRKDDSTGITLNAFGERFLTNTDEPSDWMRSNSESQNVILVDDATPGPANAFMPSGPSRSTIATMKGNLATPFVDYGMMGSQLNSSLDQSYYKTKAQLDRHVLFPDHRFFFVFDDMKAPDGQNHTYGWTGHCQGTLDLSAPQQATFTKSSGRKLDIHFFGPAVTFENYTLNMQIDWTGSEVPVPYFIAKTSGVGTQYLSALFPKDTVGSQPTYQNVVVSRGKAGKVLLDGAEYLVFCQPEPLQSVTVDGKFQTSAKLALAKSTAAGLEYLFVVDQAGPLNWSGNLMADEPAKRTYLYLPSDPVTQGPSLTTQADQWVPN